MTDQKRPSPTPVSLSESIYPQPTSRAGRGQTYGKTPIALGDLPIESVVAPIPWRELLGATGLVALLTSGVDWILGIWAGSAEGSLELAMAGAILLMSIIAGLTWSFYRYIAGLLTRGRVPSARGILWASILFLLPVTQGVRWLFMPELLVHEMPITNQGILYILATVAIWVGTVAGITGVLLRARINEKRRHQIIAWIVILPYLIAIPLGIISLTGAVQLLVQA